MSVVSLVESRLTSALFISSWRCCALSDRLMEWANNGRGVKLVSLSRVSCKTEWLEWAVILAVSACEDP